MDEINYFSMFSGVGGFERGFEKANELQRENGKGFKCVGFSEINKYAIQVYQKRFPSHTAFGDCEGIDAEELPDFGLLCGGFPCQAFSIAGRRRGFNDSRGTLFFEIARIVEAKKPKVVFLENVKGLLNHDKGKTFGVILQVLDELGYEVQWMVFNSKFFGVPQNRERVFIIANLRGTSRPEILPFRCSSKKAIIKGETQQGVLASAKTGLRLVNQSNCLDTMYPKGLGANQERVGVIKYFQKTRDQSSRVYEENGVSPTLASTPKIRAVLSPSRKNKRQNGRRFKNEEEPSFTLTGQDVHGVSDGIKIRRLTPIECERLQGFPDDWTEGLSDTQRYKAMGNAVTVNVIQAIAERLIRWFFVQGSKSR